MYALSVNTEMNLKIIGHMTKKLLKLEEDLFLIKNIFLITWGENEIYK